MSEHDAIRELLPLAAADALDEKELRRVEDHLRTCAACAAELDVWQRLERGLRRLPTPQAPTLLVERTRMQLRAQLAARQEHKSNAWVLGFLVLFSWTLVLATWPVFRLLSSGTASWLDLSFQSAWIAVAGYTLLGWVVGGATAVFIALRQAAARRTA